MNGKWDLITPNNKFNKSINESPKQNRVMMHEQAETVKNEKLFERKKRNFFEMDQSSKRGLSAPIQNLSSEQPFQSKKMEYIDKISAIPEIISSKQQPSLKTSSLNTENNTKSKFENLKFDAGANIEKYLFLDEKLVDSDRNIAWNSINPCKYFLTLVFTKKINSNYLIKNKIKFPDFLINNFNNRSQYDEKFSFSDLFLPLNLLYLVQDNIVYLWDFANEQIYTYTEIPNVIVNLHITLPKFGIFSSEVSYIMLLATTTEIYIILVIQNPQTKSLNFVKSDFIYEIKNIITCICSTSERRIFLGSQNNYLFELDYTNNYSFFGFTKRAKKITHTSESFFSKIVPNLFNMKKHSYISKLVCDNTRKILYALTLFTTDEENIYNPDSVFDSTIIIYDLGADGQKFKILGEISQSEIKERFIIISGEQTFKKENNFQILDIYPITRNESKFNNLLITTRMGLRAYISFETVEDTEQIKDEAKLLEFDKNKIFRVRPSMRYSMNLKQIPEPSNATIIEGMESDGAFRALHKAFTYNQTFYFDKKFFIFYKDDSRKKAYIDAVEFEESDQAKLHGKYSQISLSRSKESISNILKFNFNKEVYSMQKYPLSLRAQNEFQNDFSNMLKLYEYENLPPKNLNYLDSAEHLSFTCMHIFAKQIFLPPEEILVMTSSELVTVAKIRPIDNLFKIISTIENVNENFPEEIILFINEFGISETSFMLLSIMCNRNFIFFRKVEENVNGDSMFSEFNANISNILMMDTNEIRNNDRIIFNASFLFVKLIEFSFKYPQNKINETAEKREDRDVAENIIGAIAEDSQTGKLNYISYSLFMYLARIARIFWEECLFKRSPEENEFATEALKIHQIKYLQSMLLDYQLKIKEMKEKIIQRLSEIEIKMKNVKGNNYDFSNLSSEIDQSLYLSQKIIETLQFAQILYEQKSLKRHLLKIQKLLYVELTNIKFKDIVLNTNIPMIKQWLEEYFEVALNENDYLIVGNKLDEICETCPTILNFNDKELITANMLMRLSKSKINDEISRKNLISKAVSLMASNPENIKLEKSIRLLAELGEVKPIIEICIKKAIYLKNLLDREEERNISNMNMDIDSNAMTISRNGLNDAELKYYYEEYKRALYFVFKILNEIQISINNKDNVAYNSTAPDYIRNLFANSNLNIEEKISLRNMIIEDILKFDMRFLHDLLFDHLKSQDMLDDIIKYNSPYIEPYLSNQIENEKANPKRYEALYKYYINSNNYDGAVRILFNLANFDNPSPDNLEIREYVSLEDRRLYVKHLCYTIDKLIESDPDELKKSICANYKIVATDLKDSLTIQAEIFSALRGLEKNVADVYAKELILKSLTDLDRNAYDLKDLYENFSKKFKLFEINFEILFEFYNKKVSINSSEISQNFENYFDYIETIEIKKWPSISFPLLNKLFVTYVQNKTSYDSYYSILKDTHNKELKLMFPLEYLIKTIENINWRYIVKEKKIDFESKSVGRYDTNDNPFWFVVFLKDVVNLPCHVIFEFYLKFYNERKNIDFNNEFIITSLNLMQLIKLWSLSIEVYQDKVDRRESRINQNLFEDYHEYSRNFVFLQELLKEIHTVYSSQLKTTIVLDEKTKNRIISFCWTVENRLHYVVNTNQKRFASTNSHVEVLENNDNNVHTIKRPTYNISLNPNILDQCD